MPWCPNCKAEYQDGITVCSDCKIELVEDLNEAQVLIPFFQVSDKKTAEKLMKFFNYSDLFSTYEYDEETEQYVVSVPPKKQMQAKKLYQAFYMVERERAANGESDLVPDEEEDTENIDTTEVPTNSDEDTYEAADNHAQANEDSSDDEEYENDTPSDEITAFDDNEEESSPSNYVMKEDQYKDLAGTVWIFLFFGIVGIIIVLLNVIGVFHFFNGLIPQTVMGIVFLLFIYVAISTNQKAKKVQTEIAAENKLTEQINEWLKANITHSFLDSIHNENISEEFNYLKKTDTIKEMLLKEFGPQNLAYLDRLIEEYYTENFDMVNE